MTQVFDAAREIATLNSSIEALTNRFADLVLSMQACNTVMGTFATRMDELEKASTVTDDRLKSLAERIEAEVEALKGTVNGFDVDEVPTDETDDQRATRVGMTIRMHELESLLRGRNRSAPVKRNMTDDDARRVLTGDVRDQGHKEAGEAVGLTYAQVYSCRLEYTFKHVHKELRETGWRNPWAPSKK